MNYINTTISSVSKHLTMSTNTIEGANSPQNMNNDEDRRKMLSGAFDDDEVDDQAAGSVAGQSQNQSPPQAKTKTAPKNPLNRLKAARTPSGTGPNNPNQNLTVSGGTGAAGSTMVVGNPNMRKDTLAVQGTNIGSRASEPDWTNEQLQVISNLCGMKLDTLLMAETRRSIPDPESKYLSMANDGTVLTKSPAMLPNIPWTDFKLGLGEIKPDEKTGKSKIYSDVVMKGSNWLLSQWTSKNVIMEGVADNILDKPPRMVNGRPERRIGHDFARIGLPKTSFGPIFETLKSSYPSLLNAVSVTRGYYWLNASWGVTGSPGNFVYTGKAGIRSNTYKLYEAMKMISGSSSLGAATIAISVANESRLENGKLVSANAKFEPSIKIHNMFHIKKVSYHSPPQAASTGFEVGDDLLSESETLEPITNTGAMMSDTASAFSSTGANPFFGAVGSVSNNAMPGSNASKLVM